MTIDIFSKKKFSDLEYVVGIQNHDQRITERFYNDLKSYYMSSSRTLFTMGNIVEDVFQQSFVKLWTEIETRKIFAGEDGSIYRRSRTGQVFVMKCSLKTFLIDIAKNDYRDWLRHDHLVLEEDSDKLTHMVEVKSRIWETEDEDEIREQIVNSCVMNLPARCKEILTMFYYKGMSLDEILIARAEKNVSKAGLKTGKSKCLKTLKDQIRELYNINHNY